MRYPFPVFFVLFLVFQFSAKLGNHECTSTCCYLQNLVFLNIFILEVWLAKFPHMHTSSQTGFWKANFETKTKSKHVNQVKSLDRNFWLNTSIKHTSIIYFSRITKILNWHYSLKIKWGVIDILQNNIERFSKSFGEY